MVASNAINGYYLNNAWMDEAEDTVSWYSPWYSTTGTSTATSTNWNWNVYPSTPDPVPVFYRINKLVYDNEPLSEPLDELRRAVYRWLQ